MIAFIHNFFAVYTRNIMQTESIKISSQVKNEKHHSCSKMFSCLRQDEKNFRKESGFNGYINRLNRYNFGNGFADGFFNTCFHGHGTHGAAAAGAQ